MRGRAIRKYNDNYRTSAATEITPSRERDKSSNLYRVSSSRFSIIVLFSLVGVLYFVSFDTLGLSGLAIHNTTQADDTQADDTQASKKSSLNTLGLSGDTQALKKSCHKLYKGHLEKRFVKVGACYDETTVKKAHIDLIFALVDQLNQHEIEYWLMAGTLLGSFRDGKFIPWDVDGDIQVLSKGLQQICKTNFDLGSNRYIFEVYNCATKPAGGRDPPLPARFIDTDIGIYVDIFEMTNFNHATTKPSETMLSIMPSVCHGNCVGCSKVNFPKDSDKYVKHFYVPKDWIFPLSKCMFEGIEVSCPKNSQAILRYQYGDSFMEPRNFYQYKFWKLFA